MFCIFNDKEKKSVALIFVTKMNIKNILSEKSHTEKAT